MDIIKSLQWRYATKKFDTTKKLSEKQLNTLLEAVRLSPTSYGLQPWRVVVVSDPKVRSELRKAGYNQPQISESSHLLVFAVQKSIDSQYIDKYMKVVSETRGVSAESLKGFSDMLLGWSKGKSDTEKVEWAARQAYIALGVLLVTAAEEEIDAAPMEGFDQKEFDKILGLGKFGLESKVICGLGFRSSEDIYAKSPKVRFSKSDLFIEIK
jgi:nitroreductase